MMVCEKSLQKDVNFGAFRGIFRETFRGTSGGDQERRKIFRGHARQLPGVPLFDSFERPLLHFEAIFTTQPYLPDFFRGSSGLLPGA